MPVVGERCSTSTNMTKEFFFKTFERSLLIYAMVDHTNMPYEDKSFSMVVFDPPHLKCSGSKKEANGWQMVKYGNLGKDWRDMLAKGFKECFRVLKPGGFLIFKWNETDIKVSEVLKLTPEKPIFGHISGKRSNTHWICFMKEIIKEE